MRESVDEKRLGKYDKDKKTDLPEPPSVNWDDYRDIELEITVRTPNHEEKFIFCQPAKIRKIMWEDEGFLSEIVTAAVNRKNRHELTK